MFRLSRRAESDLLNIGRYTLQRWGVAQADRYLSEMRSCFERLVKNPLLGRACDSIRPGLRRMEQGSHVVFYRQQSRGILVVRVLHQSMMPERHLTENEERERI